MELLSDYGIRTRIEQEAKNKAIDTLLPRAQLIDKMKRRRDEIRRRITPLEAGHGKKYEKIPLIYPS